MSLFTDDTGGVDPESTVLTGAVEVVEPDRVAGWVEVPPGSGPARVTLWVDDLDVSTVWAADPIQRHGTGDVLSFEFPVAGLWDFVGPGNRLGVWSGGRVLPIAGHGSYAVPDNAGPATPAELRERLEAGEAFNRNGVLHLPRALDTAWQSAVLELYSSLRAELHDIAGYDAVLAYGTLLGAVRDGGFIGHDVNFDCAVLSERREPAEAARDLQRLAFALIDRGYSVRARPSALVIRRPDRPETEVRLYHVYADQSGALQFPYGVAGDSRVAVDDWIYRSEGTLAGVPVLLPANPAAVLTGVYGPQWQTPDPSFRWASARRNRVVDAHLPAAVIEEIYWADFYARTTYTTGSTFFDLVRSQPGLPGTVIDIGCGDGRDSYAFAGDGSSASRVTGLDRSHVAVRQAGRKAEQMGLADRLGFAACDVGEADRLREILLAARDAAAPTLFYLRFFLHSIPEDVQRTLMSVVADCARPGDWFAAEFRTDRDATNRKVHGNHYRRFQNGPAFGRTLAEVHGFTPVLEQEGNGFSPYRGEDPYLYRVIARRG